LWQLPPSLRFDADVLARFLESLPKTTRELERLARRHDSRLNGRAAVTAHTSGAVRHALEVRHPSFQDERYLELLRAHGVASCVADSAGLYPVIDAPTADFSYARLHGAKRLYVSGYSPRELSSWAERVAVWARRGDVFVYFDNDVKVRAPFDAQNLARLVRGEPARRAPPVLARVTEEPREVWTAWSDAGRGEVPRARRG
jgi:uncharacterized protein YecE (DUF72 family)